MRSRGALLFSQTGKTQKVLASRLRLSMGMVAMLQSGKRKPSVANRKLLLAKEGIPIESWDEDVAPPAPSTPAAPPIPWGEATTASMLESTEREIHKLVAELHADRTLTASERIKAIRSLVAALKDIWKLRGDETDFLGSPQWAKLKAELIEGLTPYPDALKVLANIGRPPGVAH